MEATEQRLRRQQQLFFEILPEGEVEFGLDPSWLSIYPYQILLSPGERHDLEIRVRNPRIESMRIEAALIAPSEWSIEPDVVKFTVAPGGSSTAKVGASVPRDWSAPSPRFAIACDVVRDGKYLGQITEAVVEMRGAL